MIVQALVKNDVLGLKKPIQGLIRDEAPPPFKFAFARSPDKVALFMDWLRGEQQQIIMDTVQGQEQSAWFSVYIQAANEKGLRDVRARLNKAGANVASSWVQRLMQSPAYGDRAALAYTRVYSDLKGITETMDQQISGILSRGLASGTAPAQMAREIASRVDKIGITRARTLARTEVISAHAEATLNGYEDAGIEGVEVMAEFSTAGDSSVCPECEKLEGKTYTISQARGLIPVHPNCRCTYTARVKNGTGIELV